MGLDNRTLASLIGLLLILVAIFAVPKARESALSIRKHIGWKVTSPFATLIAYYVALIWGASRIDLWTWSQTVPTVLWFGVAIGALFSLSNAIRERDFFRKLALRAFAWTTIIEVVVGTFVLGLGWEILLLILALPLTLLSVTAKHMGHARMASAFDWCLALLGFGLLAYSVYNIVTHWSELDHLNLVRNLFLPVWLTLALVPFMYGFAVYAAFESPLRRISAAEAPVLVKMRSRLALLGAFRGRPDLIDGFRHYQVTQLLKARSLREANAVVDQYVRRTYKREREDEVASLRLEAYAGEEGSYPDGRRLDQREFEGTRNLLDFLATCQMGHHRNRGGRYKIEILAFADGPKYGLPGDHGVQMEVADDGQSWWAHRRTVTGWVFAIGSQGSPPDSWKFDGPEPPQGGPGQAPGWSSTLTGDRPPNW